MAHQDSGAINLMVVEEQEIFRQAYPLVFTHGCGINLLTVTPYGRGETLNPVLSKLCPDLLLIGWNEVDKSKIAELFEINKRFPHVGMAVLFSSYAAEDIGLFRPLMLKRIGLTICLKGSVDGLEQLRQMVRDTAKKHVVVDPALASLLFADESIHSRLKKLTKREREVLSLMADGCTNLAIANTLYIDIKTVHHHINSIYAKISADAHMDNRHPRVNASRLYLETTGQLLAAGSDRRI